MAEKLIELPALSEPVFKKILLIKPVHKKPPFPEVPCCRRGVSFPFSCQFRDGESSTRVYGLERYCLYPLTTRPWLLKKSIREASTFNGMVTAQAPVFASRSISIHWSSGIRTCRNGAEPAGARSQIHHMRPLFGCGPSLKRTLTRSLSLSTL